MKNQSKLILSFFIGFFFFFTSCEKDNNVFDLTQNEIKETKNISGSLANEPYNGNANIKKFESKLDFQNTINNLQKYDLKNLKSSPELKGFYSLKDYNFDRNKKNLANLRVETQNDEKLIFDDDDELVYDPYFAAILNENREIEIEGITFRIIPEGLIAYSNNQSKQAIQFREDIKNKKIKISKTDPMIISDDLSFFAQELFKNSEKNKAHKGARVVSTSSGAGFFGSNHEAFHEYDSNDFRVKGRTWSQSFGIYASIGTKTTHQWKRFGVWLSKDADFISRKMNIFQVEFQDALGFITVIDFAQINPANFGSANNHHEVSWVDDFQTAVFTIKPPFIKKPAKARKFKKYDTEHIANKNGNGGHVQLKYN